MRREKNLKLSTILRDIIQGRLRLSIWVVVLTLLFGIGFYPRQLYAQSENRIIFQPSKLSVAASNEELIDLTLKVVNRTEAVLTGNITLNLPANLDLISKAKTPVSLQPGDSTYVPIKVFITRKMVSGQEHQLNFLFSDNSNQILAKASTGLQVSVKRNVNMYSLLSNVLLDEFTDSIKIPIRISNAGNTAQTITIINRYPSAFQDNAFHTTRKILLQASADTLITFTKEVGRKMFNSDGFDVTFTGLYENGDVLGMAYVRIQSARSNRAFQDRSISDSYNLNTITVSSQAMFTQNQSYLLTGRGNLELPIGKLGYNLDYTTWQNSYTSPMLRSTYVSFESHNMGFIAGNINRSMDINLAGRGGSVFIRDTAANNEYEAGYIDGSTNLLGENNNSFLPPGNAGWGTFSHNTQDWGFSSSAIYEVNPLLQSRSILLGNTFNLTKYKDFRLQANLSGGHTADYNNPNQNRPSLAAGFAFNGTFDKISINSLNYYSSSYYPGMRRGAMSFNERITLLRENSNIWASVDYNRYAPKTFSDFQLFMPVFGTTRAEIGISGNPFKNAVVSIAPLYTSEVNNSYRIPGLQDSVHRMKSFNLLGSLNYTIGNSQFLSLNIESGFYNSTFDSEMKFHLRSNMNYKRGSFNLSSSIQLGTFFLGEAANNFVRNVPSQRIINITPSYQKAFFRNKLRTETGIALSNTSASGNNFYLTGRVEYDVLAKTTYFAAINHNYFNNYSLSLIEMGITQNVAFSKIGAQTTDMEVFVYRDINQNGKFDQGDEKAQGHLIYINNAAFVTGVGGTAVYKKLPYESYRITFNNSGGWYAPDEYVKLDQKKQRIEVGLKQTGTIRGTLSYVFDEFSYDINKNLQGIAVIATDENNNRHLTKTNLEGQFVFYLPLGRYTVKLDSSNLPAEVEVQNEPDPFDLELHKPQELLIKLLVKSRKIETKKFTSPNSGKRK